MRLLGEALRPPAKLLRILWAISSRREINLWLPTPPRYPTRTSFRCFKASTIMSSNREEERSHNQINSRLSNSCPEQIHSLSS